MKRNKKHENFLKISHFILIFSAFFVFAGCTQIVIGGLPHPAPAKLNDHVDAPIYYNSDYYYGRKKGGSTSLVVKTYQAHVTISSPSVTNFSADGFFEMRGSVSCSSAKNYMLLLVTKDGTDDVSRYFLRGSFNQRIWLPFGKGNYTIKAIEFTNVQTGNGDNGDIRAWESYAQPMFTLNVNNTRDEDGCFLYPSNYVQSDNEELRNYALTVTRGKVTPVDKVRAVHDAVFRLLDYDEASLSPGARKKQDALTVFRLKTGVCEGYTSLMAALLRSLGIRTKCVCGFGITNGGGGGSGLHAWNHVEVRKDGVKKYYLLDATWDDPTGWNGGPRHDFFLLDLEANENGNRQNHRQGVKDRFNTPLDGNDGKNRGTRRGRSVIADWQLPETESELTYALNRRFPLLETNY